MTIQRAPIRRPGLPETLGDHQNRIRAAEAAKGLPYIAAAMEFEWQNSGDTEREIDFTQSQTTIYGSSVYSTNPNNFYADASGGWYWNFVQLGGIVIDQPGFYAWWAQVRFQKWVTYGVGATVDFQWYPDDLTESWPAIMLSAIDPSIQVPPKLQPITPTPYATFADANMHGVYSANGFRVGDPGDVGGVPASTKPRLLRITVFRDDPAKTYDVECRVMVVQLSPHGFFPFAGEPE